MSISNPAPLPSLSSLFSQRAAFAESASAADAFVSGTLQTASLTGTAIAAAQDSFNGTLRVSFAESASATDSGAATLIARPQFAEQAVAAGQFTAGYRIIFAEPASAAETWNGDAPKFDVMAEAAAAVANFDGLRIAGGQAFAEDAAGADTFATFYVGRVSFTEAAAGADGFDTAGAWSVTLAETAAAADAFATTGTLVASFTDSASAGESFFTVAVGQFMRPGPLPSLSLLGGFSAPFVTEAEFTDTAASSDAFVGAVIPAVLVTFQWDDIVGGAEDGYRLQYGPSSGNYTQSVDLAANVLQYQIALPYRTAWYWRVAGLVGGAVQTWSYENIVYTDAGTFAESANAIDAFSWGSGAQVVAFSDAANAQDARSAIATARSSFAETANAQDAFAGGYQTAASFSEAAAAQDRGDTVLRFTEAASASDSFSSQGVATFVESGNAADSFAASGTLVAAFADPAAGTDTFSAPLDVALSLAEAAAADESFDAAHVGLVSFDDAAFAFEGFVAGTDVKTVSETFAEIVSAQDDASATSDMLCAFAEAAGAADGFSHGTVYADLAEAADAAESFIGSVDCAAIFDDAGLALEIFASGIANIVTRDEAIYPREIFTARVRRLGAWRTFGETPLAVRIGQASGRARGPKT